VNEPIGITQTLAHFQRTFAPSPRHPAFAQGSGAARRTMRFRVSGRNHYTFHEIGIFSASTPFEACARARREQGHLCGGLHLKAEEA
jgi:hypothetical protein